MFLQKKTVALNTVVRFGVSTYSEPRLDVGKTSTKWRLAFIPGPKLKKAVERKKRSEYKLGRIRQAHAISILFTRCSPLLTVTK
jgi:hypothetical protein